MQVEVTPYKKLNQDPNAISAFEGITITKRLKIMNVSEGSDAKKVVISSLDIVAAGLEIGDQFINEDDDDGMTLTPLSMANKDTIKLIRPNTVSKREYKGRNSYIEPVIDIRHQTKMKRSLALDKATHVHIIISQGKIRIVPDLDHIEEAQSSCAGIVFNMGSKNKKGVYDGIMKLLSLVKDKKFAHVKVTAETDFKESHEFKLLELQFRRLGYGISFNDDGEIIADISGAKSVKHTMVTENIRPAHSDILKHRDRINSGFDSTDPLSTFSVCSSGIDMMLLEKEGFNTTHLLEYRPHESRDIVKAKDPITGKAIKDQFKKNVNATCPLGGEQILKGWDKTISGVISALTNVKSLHTVFNEDIFKFKNNRVKPLMKAFQHIHASIQCDDFCSQKTLLERAIALANMTSTADMFIKFLEIVQATPAPTLSIENVKSFATSTECLLLEGELEEMGYKVYKKVMYAPDFGGYTGRARTYLFATTLPIDFKFPVPEMPNVNAWDDIISNNLHHMKKVNSEATIEEAIKKGRDRFYRAGTAVFPTITKSNLKYTKDTTYYVSDDGYFIPDAELSKKLMGVEDFDLSTLGNEALAVEVIGQSVDASMHGKLTAQIKSHIMSYANAILSSNPTQLSLAI
jgi:site-specific DNA-cytosine methylase